MCVMKKAVGAMELYLTKYTKADGRVVRDTGFSKGINCKNDPNSPQVHVFISSAT